MPANHPHDHPPQNPTACPLGLRFASQSADSFSTAPIGTADAFKRLPVCAATGGDYRGIARVVRARF